MITHLEDKLIYREILFKKATDTGHIAHSLIEDKLIYKEILFKKATDTGHIAHFTSQLTLEESTPYGLPRYRRSKG